MAHKSLTTRQKMVFRVKPSAPFAATRQTHVPRAKLKTPTLPAAAQRAPKPSR